MAPQTYGCLTMRLAQQCVLLRYTTVTIGHLKTEIKKTTNGGKNSGTCAPKLN